MPSLERIWPGETAVILGSGPSLTQADADYVRGKARVIAINTSYQLAPWADVLYAADRAWWRTYKPDFQGLKVGARRENKKNLRWPEGIIVLDALSERGLSDDPSMICTGKNSGYQAINLAHLLGITRIILLGYDMSRDASGRYYWHKRHPHQEPKDNYLMFRKLMRHIVAPLRERGITVLNASRRTALECFPRVRLEDAL